MPPTTMPMTRAAVLFGIVFTVCFVLVYFTVILSVFAVLLTLWMSWTAGRAAFRSNT